MADPVINALILSKTVINAGETITARIDASDPDARSGVLTGTVKDSAGNTATITGTVSLSDPLTYSLEDTDGLGFTIVQDATDPSLFHLTAP
jgi:hypothetical protein